MKNIRIFYLKISFLVVKFSIYLNRRVFVMYLISDEGSFLILLLEYPELKMSRILCFSHKCIGVGVR